MRKASGMKVQEILQKGEKIVNQGGGVIRAGKVEEEKTNGSIKERENIVSGKLGGKHSVQG
jgi:hypothetical protein